MQSYETGVSYEDVLLGNDVIFKCKVPSFVNDFVHIINWVDNDGISYYPRIAKGKTWAVLYTESILYTNIH